MNFYITDREAREIGISVIAISVAFAIAIFGLGVFMDLHAAAVVVSFFLATIGVGFILHEMAHKVSANFFGAAAEFRMWTQGLMFMLLLSFMGFVFAAPGAVYIYSPHLTRRENGIISLAGPATNLVLAMFFIALSIFAPVEIAGMNVWEWGAMINIFIGFFNMLPMFPLDGSKIIAWSMPVWLVFAAVFFGFGFLLIGPQIIVMWALMLAFSFLLSGALFGGRRGY
ncbi:MAG TPA: site-2 protease family protein [Candidatus Bilamarchaeaceae archaeon]|nr:site-2 protease family protein [Candidatus Bilamarchaeaceae archaeon]